MSGIIELWRKERHPMQPIRFVVGAQPLLSSGDAEEDSPAVKNIVYRELRTLGKVRYSEPLFCVTFENSPVQRLIPASDMTEVAYETKEADIVKTPGLEAD